MHAVLCYTDLNIYEGGTLNLTVDSSANFSITVPLIAYGVTYEESSYTAALITNTTISISRNSVHVSVQFSVSPIEDDQNVQIITAQLTDDAMVLNGNDEATASNYNGVTVLYVTIDFGNFIQSAPSSMVTTFLSFHSFLQDNELIFLSRQEVCN